MSCEPCCGFGLDWSIGVEIGVWIQTHGKSFCSRIARRILGASTKSTKKDTASVLPEAVHIIHMMGEENFLLCLYVRTFIPKLQEKFSVFFKNFHFFRDCVRAYFCGRPRGLEVEAARNCVDIQTFARKEKGILAF